MKKAWKITLISAASFITAAGTAAGICLYHYIGIPECVGETEYRYQIKEVHTVFGDYDFYGKAIVPKGNKDKYPTVIYVHGAESTHSADITTLKSLAMSGIASYTFDIYGWSARSTGPNGRGDYFKGTPRGVDDSYQKQVVLQAWYLDNIIENVKTFSFVDTDSLYVVGSSMGGATSAACVIHHNDDIKGTVLQYPAMNLVPGAMVDGDAYDINQYTNRMLILQGTADKIVPYSMSIDMNSHLNKLYEGHSTLVTYDGQPHVFTGKYKVKAAFDIYKFITE